MSASSPPPDWSSFEDVGIVPINKREHPDHYRARCMVVKAKRLEKLVEAFAAGKCKTKRDIDRLAKSCHATPEAILHMKFHPNMPKVLKERIQARALHLMAENMEAMAALSKKNPVAFKALAQIAGFGEKGANVNVQFNTAIDARKGETEGDRAFIEGFRERQKDGLIKRLEVVNGTGNGEIREDHQAGGGTSGSGDAR